MGLSRAKKQSEQGESLGESQKGLSVRENGQITPFNFAPKSLLLLRLKKLPPWGTLLKEDAPRRLLYQNRVIDFAERVWLIPKDAKKPIDRRKKNNGK